MEPQKTVVPKNPRKCGNTGSPCKDKGALAQGGTALSTNSNDFSMSALENFWWQFGGFEI
jgi:hypothetical protein